MNDVIIIGAGPAGCTAAIYTSRAGLKTFVFGSVERSNTYRAHVIENFFGKKGPVKGADLMEEGKKQAEKFGAKFTDKEIVNIKKNGDFFEIIDSERQKHGARAVIICAGLGFKSSGIKNEVQFIGKGVSYCVNCDGFFFKGKKIAVIGSTNFAGEEALQLLTYSSNITLLSHGSEFNFDPKVQLDLDKGKIVQLKTSRISEFAGGENSLEKIKFSDGSEMNFDGAFLALGLASASDFANKLSIMRTGPQNTFIEINSRTGETNVAGVFAAGDCTGGNAQAIKSAGEGCNAGISVVKFLKGLKAYADYC